MDSLDLSPIVSYKVNKLRKEVKVMTENLNKRVKIMNPYSTALLM
jgi:hypothetical protein